MSWTSSNIHRQSFVSRAYCHGQRKRLAAYPRFRTRDSSMSWVPMMIASRSG